MKATRTVLFASAVSLLWSAAARSANASPVTYDYVGSPFTTCSYGTCPANYTSDYLIASVTFASALPANLALTNETSSLIGWTIQDALGYFSYSSSNPATSTYLTGDPSVSIPPAEFSTNSSGGIVDFEMAALPAELLAVVGATEGGLLNPALTHDGYSIASFIEFEEGTPAEWDALTSAEGSWSAAIATPEPSTLVLVSFGALILALKMKAKSR